MDRITAIRKSLTAYGCGIAACVPFLGVIPAICALVIGEMVVRQYHDWNPASHYLKRGRVLGVVGLLVTALTVFLILFANVYWGEGGTYGCPGGEE